MCTQIKEKWKKNRAERGWRVQETDTHTVREKERPGWECSRWGRGKTSEEEPPESTRERKTFWSGGSSCGRGGVKMRAERRRGVDKRHRSQANDRQWEQQRKIEDWEKKKKMYKLPTPYLLFSIKLIFSSFKWLLQVSLRGNIYSYHNAAYTRLPMTGRAAEKSGGHQSKWTKIWKKEYSEIKRAGIFKPKHMTNSKMQLFLMLFFRNGI